MNYSTSKQLIENAKDFFPIKYYSPLESFLGRNGTFYGWGRKRSGERAVALAQKHSRSFVLLEDGFIRSVGLGVDGWKSFSVVEDSVGIYYDATKVSRLEEILQTQKFDLSMQQQAQKAIALIKKYKISKYNNATEELPHLADGKRVLIVAQTKGDKSLELGLATDANKMVEDALREHSDATVYIKIHPDVLSGKKESSIDATLLSRCEVLPQNYNPIALIEMFDAVYTQTSQMGFEALLLGKKVFLYGAPFYAGWQVENIVWRVPDEVKSMLAGRRTIQRSVEEIFYAAYILYTTYYNPYTEKKSDILDCIETIAHYKKIYATNDAKLFFFGFSLWKQNNTLNFFQPLTDNETFFCESLEDAKKKGLDSQSKLYIWGKKKFDDVELWAKEYGVNISRIEDGFVRSVSLGSDLTKAYSLVVDSRGIYFDPTQSSDLEYILQHHTFDEKIVQRAKKLQNYLVDNKLSKYNANEDRKLHFDTEKKIVLVIGQVEDDASIIYGGEGMSNLELLKKVHETRRDEYIVYKPHPDVLAGNRKGTISKEDMQNYADEVQESISLPSLLEVCDELHTITSLSGFEALLRGKEVYVYGMPFYAGWGLTHDAKELQRRERKLSLEELVAAVYILYPRYINPKDDTLCEVEVVLEALEVQKRRYQTDRWYRYSLYMRNFISRKLQFLVRSLLFFR